MFSAGGASKRPSGCRGILRKEEGVMGWVHMELVQEAITQASFMISCLTIKRSSQTQKKRITMTAS